MERETISFQDVSSGLFSDQPVRQQELAVKMVFALNTDNYVADVRVKVKDVYGRTVIDGVAKGPWLYARLPAGTCTASATYAGHTVTEEFTVWRSGQRTAYFRWPASVEQQAVAGASSLLGTGPQEPQGMR